MGGRERNAFLDEVLQLARDMDRDRNRDRERQRKGKGMYDQVHIRYVCLGVPLPKHPNRLSNWTYSEEGELRGGGEAPR